MIWSLKSAPEKTEVTSIAKALGVSYLLASLLVQRGITDFESARDFFRPKLDHLHDPFLMRDMLKATTRVEKALENGEHIMVYGDYDVDGTCAVALVSGFLNSLGARVSCYIPDRYKEGYGISFISLDYAVKKKASLIIALDCGIKAIEQVADGRAKGLDFIICDHHKPGFELPDAVAILNPKQAACTYPFKELCGCGLGLKLVQALLIKGENKDETALNQWLDLVVTATAADIVPLTGENRTLAYLGLQRLNENPRPGLKVFTQPLDKELSITDIVFKVAPRINAAGRIQHGMNAVNLLTETNANDALVMAGAIEEFNTRRVEIDKQITHEALQQIVSQKEENCATTVVFKPNWHKGVIGIVASRLIEKYYRPTVVLTKNENTITGSARSVRGFDIYRALETCSDDFLSFGGHKYAAGITLKPEKFLKFKENFEKTVTNSLLPENRHRQLEIDLKLDFKEITPKFFRILKQFAPFGPGNPTPVFLAYNLMDTGYARRVGTNGQHLKCALIQEGSAFNAIGFDMGDSHEILENKGRVDIAFSVEENSWKGRTELQLKLRAIRPAVL